MTVDEAIEQFVAMPEERKALFLVSLSWWLTVWLRGCYDEADEGLRAQKLQGANEIQHRLASEAGHHLAGGLERYPDDVLIRSCIETGAHYGMGGEFRGALKSALDRFEKRQNQDRLL